MVELVLQFARKALLGLALLGVLLTAVGGWTFVNAYRVIDNGTTATATVLDMTRNITDEGRRSERNSYSSNMVWRDAAGERRHAMRIRIPEDVARGMLDGDRIARPTVDILYVEDDPGIDPMVASGAVARRDDALGMLGYGLLMLLAGAGGAWGVRELRRKRLHAAAVGASPQPAPSAPD